MAYPIPSHRLSSLLQGRVLGASVKSSEREHQEAVVSQKVKEDKARTGSGVDEQVVFVVR